jgi:transcriptional regulator with XRE-family HTH domain
MSTARPRRTAGEPTALVRDFGANLTECREEEGITRDDLAEAAEIGIEHLIELEEAGGTIPSIGVVLRLAGALGQMPSRLVEGVEWVPFEFSAAQGWFEVVDDEELFAEIVALKEGLPRRAGEDRSYPSAARREQGSD